MDQLVVTKVIRAIMRAQGWRGWNIWTNKSTRSRSVKCYEAYDEWENLKMIDAVCNVLDALKVRYEVVRTEGSPYHQMGGIIFRLPY